MGSCGSGLECLACGTIQPGYYLCSMACKTNADCRDSARPKCDVPPGKTTGVCVAADVACCWQCKCASPDTLISTPEGARAIASLREGDLVLSLHHAQLVAVPIVRVVRVPAMGHHVARVALTNGSVLEISRRHPTADGRSFTDLSPGDNLGGATIASLQTVAYRHSHTYDILPASDSGTYVAGGALVGSTLAPHRSRAPCGQR